MILIAGLINMDAGSYFEESKNAVVVAAKHIGSFGKPALKRTMLGLNGSAVDGVLNMSAICQVDDVPSMQEYYTGNVNCTAFWRWCLCVALDGNLYCALEWLHNILRQSNEFWVCCAVSKTFNSLWMVLSNINSAACGPYCAITIGSSVESDEQYLLNSLSTVLRSIN